MDVRRLALVSVPVFLVLSIGNVAFSARRVVGGTGILVQATPWTVLVRQFSSAGTLLCGGSVLDALHIVTAAHCVYDLNGFQAAPSALSIRAGISASVPLTTDEEQDRSVSSVHIAAGYLWSRGASANDVALLTLTTRFDLNSPAITPVAIPRPGAAYPTGMQAELAGFGRQSPAAPPDGSLQRMFATVEPQPACSGGNTTSVATAAVSLCASSESSAICSGDSGAGLVLLSSTPTLLGVVSSGPPDCSPGSSGLFTYIGAPEILSLIADVTTPPTPPTATTTTPTDAAALASSRPLAPNSSSPTITLTTSEPMTGTRGATLYFRVILNTPRGPTQKLGVCLTPPAQVASRVCAYRPVRAQAQRFQFGLGVHIKPAAPLGDARVVISTIGDNIQEATTVLRVTARPT